MMSAIVCDDGEGGRRIGGKCSPRPPHCAIWLGMSTVLALYALTVSQPNAAADMKPLLEFEWTIGASFVLFLMNLPFNLLAYSALLLVLCRVWGTGLGDLPKDAMTFTSRIFLVVLLITILGVEIDFLFLYNYETRYVFEYDLLKWLVASAAVGLSVYALSLTLLRIDIVLGAIPALAMIGLNLASWWFTYQLFNSSWIICLAGPSLLAAALSAIPLVYLLRWHRRAFAHEPADIT